MNLERANWTLDANRDWHVSWFHECLRIIDAFTYQDWRHMSNNAATFKGGTNLCHYVRCSAVWGPGIIFLQLLMISLVMGAMLFMPLQVLGIMGYITLLIALAIVAGTCFGLYAFLTWAEKTSPGRRFNRWLTWILVEPVKDFAERNAERVAFRNSEGVSFWSMVWTLIVTLKHQICPLLQIKESK